MDSLFYDFDGKPIELMEWAKLFEDFYGRCIGDHEHGNIRVSTIWMGTNQPGVPGG